VLSSALSKAARLKPMQIKHMISSSRAILAIDTFMGLSSTPLLDLEL
jgi:hypothetical protein